MAAPEREQLLNQIEHEVGYCVRLGKCDNVADRLTDIERQLNLVRGGLLREDEADLLFQKVQNVRDEIWISADEPTHAQAFKPCKVQDGRPGRPAFDITVEMLRFLVQNDLSIKEMGQCLRMNARTVARHLKKHNIALSKPNASREEVDEAVQRIALNRRIGPNSILQRLRQMGLNCTREMVRESCRRVDPDGVALRSLLRHNVRRRTYKVAHPNSLWHLDGNHKLVRWSFIIHGGVDGFSRLLVFLHSSDNNRASTVLELFQKAEQKYGLPMRVRVDCGVENVGVAAYMQEKRRDVPGCLLRGKSCHNQRIERLWVDVWNGVTNVYRDMFVLMEMQEDLNINDPVHLWVLHFVFGPRLNHALSQFTFQWNHHGLSTECHKSPSNLFVSGILKAANSNSRSIQELFDSPVLPEAVAPPGEEEVVELQVPHAIDDDASDTVACTLSPDQVDTIKSVVNPLERIEDTLYGQHLFNKALQAL